MCDYKKIPSGLLGQKQIKHAILNYDLIAEYDLNCLQPCTYDLRVGTIYKEGRMIEDNSPIDIEPGEIITIHTIETLNLPNDIAATVFPINGQSSEGLMVLNPGHIDPGYKGMVTVKAINFRKNPLNIMRKDKIFTIIFELPQETTPYSNNIDNEIKKRNQLKKERDISPENLFSIPRYLKKGKVFSYTESDVHRIVNENGLAKIPLYIALLALLLSITTFVYAIIKDCSTTYEKTDRKQLNPELLMSQIGETNNEIPKIEITRKKEEINESSGDPNL